MAYIRKRGNQLVIVHGERDPETGKVQQRILFTIYSKAEALRIIGKNDESGSVWFKNLFTEQYPGIRISWGKIVKSIEENLDVLPDLYQYKTSRLQGGFRKELCDFTKQILLTDPQELFSSAQLINENQYELEFLAEMLQWRLILREQEPNEWNKDDPFYWRSAMRGGRVPPEIEEKAESYYLDKKYDKARSVFKLLIECFKNYAEGYNYLGLIALEEGDYIEAKSMFRETISVGQRWFPKKLAKKYFWQDLSTRPYMRGLRNLAYTLNLAGEYDEALSVCSHLENQCGDDLIANSYRAYIYMNTRFWEQALEAARYAHKINPIFSFVASMANYELGRYEGALDFFLFGMFNCPKSSMMLTNQPSTKPMSIDDITDHNQGVELCCSLSHYLDTQSINTKQFFQTIVRHPLVMETLNRLSDAKKEMDGKDNSNYRNGFEIMKNIQSWEYAKKCSETMEDVIPLR